MYLVRRYRQTIGWFVNADTPRAFLVAGIVTGLVVGSLVAVLAWAGAPVMNGRPWDSPICLDAAWRIAHGQVPHRDFYSHLGSFPFYLTWLGMKIGHPCVGSIQSGTLALTLCLTACSFFTLRRRTSALYCSLFSCFLGVLVMTPRPLGDPYDYVDHAMVYNRIGEALLLVLGILSFVPVRADRRWPAVEALEASLAGLLLTALWFTKLNYCAIGVGFIITAGLLNCRSLRWTLWCAVCAALSAGFFLILTGIPLPAMVQDFRLMTEAQSASGRASTLLIQTAKNGLPLALVAALAAEAFCGEARSQTRRLTRFRTWIISGVVFVGGLLLLASNCQVGELPLLGVAALYCAENIRRQVPSGSALVYATALRSSIACGLVLCLMMPTLGTDLSSIRYAARAALRGDFFSSETLKSTNLSDFRFSPNGTRFLYSQQYLESLDEGIRLLRRHINDGSPQMRLGVVLFANPFHLALDLPPAQGGSICWIWNVWDKRSHPPLSRLLGNATHILTGQGCQDLRDTYGAEWDSLQVETVEETRHFSLVKLR